MSISPVVLVSLLGIGCLRAEGAPFFQADVAVAGPSRAPSPYCPPRGQWERRAPALVGMDPALIDSAVAFAAKAMESMAPRDLLRAHWESSYGREPVPAPLGPFKPRGDMTGDHRQERVPGGGVGRA
jgi:hypothetical protein